MPTSGIQVKTAPSMTAVQRRWYDHRLRLGIATSGDTGLFRDVDIRMADALTRAKSGQHNVVMSEAKKPEVSDYASARAAKEARQQRDRERLASGAASPEERRGALAGLPPAQFRGSYR